MQDAPGEIDAADIQGDQFGAADAGSVQQRDDQPPLPAAPPLQRNLVASDDLVHVLFGDREGGPVEILLHRGVPVEHRQALLLFRPADGPGGIGGEFSLFHQVAAETAEDRQVLGHRPRILLPAVQQPYFIVADGGRRHCIQQGHIRTVCGAIPGELGQHIPVYGLRPRRIAADGSDIAYEIVGQHSCNPKSAAMDRMYASVASKVFATLPSSTASLMASLRRPIVLHGPMP